MNKMPNQKMLKEYFEYNGANLVRRKQMGQRGRVGDICGWVTSKGYTAIQIDGKQYQAHRIIWKLVHGTEPKQIDHINGDRSDNRIENLREVNGTQNARNMKLRTCNTVGCHGVYKHGGRWRAVITLGGKKKHLGVFDSTKEAIAARKAAERKYGFHENHGSKNAD